MQKTILILLFVAGVLSLQAQEKWVSVQEMRQAFFDNYEKKQSESIAIDKRYMALDGDKRNVYIVGCLDKDNTLSVPDIVESIRKQEYTGHLDELQEPLKYMGNEVSGVRRVVWRLSGKEAMSKTQTVKKPKSLSYECGKHYSIPYINDKGESIDVAYTGERPRPSWTQEVRSEMMGLADLVNQAWSKEKHDFKTGFAYGCIALLYVSPEGKLDVDILLPKSPDSNTEKVYNLFRKVVRSLPQWTISYLWRIDGKIFPGRYLKCTLMPHGTWRFTDYLFWNNSSK